MHQLYIFFDLFWVGPVVFIVLSMHLIGSPVHRQFSPPSLHLHFYEFFKLTNVVQTTVPYRLLFLTITSHKLWDCVTQPLEIAVKSFWKPYVWISCREFHDDWNHRGSNHKMLEGVTYITFGIRAIKVKRLSMGSLQRFRFVIQNRIEHRMHWYSKRIFT